jgi:quercetin dioxygenase-like cupin family protein
MARVLAWDDIPTEQVFPGITRQVVDTERQTIVRYVYQPGSVFPIHAHPEEQMTAILTGTIVFDVDGQRVELSAGQLAVIPPNVPHGATVEGSETVETINTLSPRRQASPFAQSS